MLASPTYVGGAFSLTASDLRILQAPPPVPKSLSASTLGTKKNVIISHFMLAITPESVILVL